MAAITVAFDGTRWEDAESLTPAGPTPPAGTWSEAGTDAAALETNFVYQGTTCIALTIKKSNQGGPMWLPTATVDLTSSVLIFKAMITTPGLMGLVDADGVIVELGSGGERGDYVEYYIAINTRICW